MDCGVSEDQLWSWVDRDAPELDAHLVACETCRARAAAIRARISALSGNGEVPSLPLPATIGQYAVKRLIGEGGQGLVYEAEQQTPRRPVAVKVLRGGRCVSEQEVRHFHREIQTLAALHHPAIATIYDAGCTAEGQNFFAMELLRGKPLDQYVREHGLPLPERLELFRKVCDAAHYAHQHAVIHRDIKPNNILIDADGNPKILDFGLARLTGADVTVSLAGTQAGQILGTLRYMSPEQTRGESKNTGPPSDVYSLGVILYELITGQSPYDVDQPVGDALRTICDATPRRPSTISRALRGDVETIVLKALEKEPARRYASAGDLSEDLRRYLADEPILAKPPSLIYLLRRRLTRHRRKVVWAGVGLGLAVVGLSIGLWWYHRVLEAARVEAIQIRYLVDCQEVDTVRPRAVALRTAWPELPEAHLLEYHITLRSAGVRARNDAIGALLARQEDRERWYFAALLAEVCRETGDLARAKTLEAQAEQETPETAEAWYLRSFATMDREKGLEWARHAADAASGQLTQLAWQRIAWSSLSAYDQDGWEDALLAAEKLLATGADWAEWTRFRAGVLVRLDRVPEAIAQYDSLVARNPSDPSAYVERAHAWRRLGEYQKAVDDYTTAMALAASDQPPPTWRRYQRAAPLWILGRTRQAEEDYRSVRPHLSSPGYADARLYIILRDEGRESEANEMLNAMLKGSEDKDTGSDRWLREICKCLSGGTKPTPDELIADAQRRDNREHKCEAYYYAGEACRLRGDLEQAREYFRQCVKTDVKFDVDSFPDPMNEYELAEWRLRQLSAESQPGSRPVSP